VDFDVSSLKYNAQGLIPAIAQDAASGDVLMMAWMNAASIKMTLKSGEVTYWSRSRQEFWVKGKTSGHTQALVEFRIDCDRDCVLMKVRQVGAACHTNRENCFFTLVKDGGEVITSDPIS